MGDDGKTPPAAAVSFLQTKGGIALFTGLLTLAGSLITATYTYVSSHGQVQFEKQVKDRELALADLKEDHSIEKEYFLKAVDPGNPPDVRSRILRYITISTRVAPEMKDWAKAELLQVDAELNAKTDHLEALVADASQELKRTRDELDKADADKKDAAAKTALLRKKNEQEQVFNELTLRAATSKAVAGASQKSAALLTQGAMCDPASIRAVELGPDDPDQATADAQCKGSALERRFDVKPGARTTWLVRREGRNFQCECQVR